MFDIGWVEIFIIGALALLVVGPRDMPKVLKTIMQVVGKLRGMAREVQSGVKDLVREAELDEMKKAVTDSAPTDLNGDVGSFLDPDGTLQTSLEEMAESDLDRPTREAVEDKNPSDDAPRSAAESGEPETDK